MSLAVRLRTDSQRNVCLERRPSQLGRYTVGRFDEATDPDTAQHASLRRSLTSLAQSVWIGGCERIVQIFTETAAIEGVLWIVRTGSPA